MDTFSLNGFNNKQEEYPRLVTNSKGGSWMFSLRRLPFPQNKEEIACYKLVNAKWQEAGTASIKSGQFENPTAVCFILITCSTILTVRDQPALPAKRLKILIS